MSGRLSRAANKLAARLEPAFSDEDVAFAKRTLLEACKATRRVRERNPDGDIIYTDVPDQPVRLAASVHLLQWSLGKPVASSVHMSITAGETPGIEGAFMKDMMSDPDSLSALEETLLKIRDAKMRLAKPVHAIDVKTELVPPEKRDSRSACDS